MKLGLFFVEPTERVSFLTLLHRHGLPENDFVLTALDTENGISQRALAAYEWVAVSRISTGVKRVYLANDENDWLAAFSKDVRAGMFVRN
jgi:hypothetical protein